MPFFQSHLSRLESSLNTSDIFYRRMTLCNSLAGNPCDVITITAQPRHSDPKSIELLSKWLANQFKVIFVVDFSLQYMTAVYVIHFRKPTVYISHQSRSSWWKQLKLGDERYLTLSLFALLVKFLTCVLVTLIADVRDRSTFEGRFGIGPFLNNFMH